MTETSVEECIGFILRALASNLDIGTHGRAVHIPDAAYHFVQDRVGKRIESNEAVRLRPLNLMDSLYAGAWELCRKGILRPATAGGSGAIGGANGDGIDYYELTPGGSELLQDEDLELVLSVETGRMASVLAGYAGQFGTGFLQRSNEAVSSYHSLNYLSCCAMCGAAAESMLLALAIAKHGNPDSVLK